MSTMVLYCWCHSDSAFSSFVFFLLKIFVKSWYCFDIDKSTVQLQPSRSLYFVTSPFYWWFYGTSPPWNKTPLIPNTYINIVNIMLEWGLDQRGDILAIWSWLCYMDRRVLWQFFGFFVFCIETYKFLLIFLTIINICKEMSISMSFSRFSVSISKGPSTILYPCITVILFLRIPHFGLTAAWLYNQLPKMVFNVVERVVLFISTA